MRILSNNQKMAIDLLANSKLQEKFYWTGGTLLAYHYLQHRKSEDLDFFTEKKFSFKERQKIIMEIKEYFKSVSNQYLNKYIR